MTRRTRAAVDSDTLAIRRASRIVGTRIALACTAVVVVLIGGVFIAILSEISAAELFTPNDTDNVKIGAAELLRDAAVLGVALIVLAGVLSWLVTRRAVQPLGDALRIQRAFIADASHELRTPLAVLDARLQLLQRSLPTDDASAIAVAELRDDAKALTQIVNDLLETAETEGPGAAAATPTALNPAVHAAVQSMSLIGDDAGVSIELRDTETVETLVPASNVQRCVVALLDNALRFSPAASTIVVSITASRSSVTVMVTDQGPGIRGIEPERIFDRFARSGPSQDGGGNATTGFGIGLALVRDIAVRHGGSVRVVASSPAGTAIAFSVPRVR